MKFLISFWLWLTGILFFLFSFIILVLCLFFLSREKTFAAARFLFKIQIRLMGIRLVVKGLENIDPFQTYLIMGNHQSLFDIFVIPAAVPVVFTGVEAAGHWKIPVWGYIIRKWGCIPIQRDDLDSAIKSLEKAKETILSGLSIGILPEGHRTLTGKMGTFKKGPFHLAKGAGADILPLGVKGLYQYQKKGSFILNPGTVIVNIGTVIPYEQYRDFSVEEIRDLVFEKIHDLSR